MGAAGSYGNLEIPLGKPEAGHGLPLQLRVEDETVAPGLGRIAQHAANGRPGSVADPFDLISLPNNDSLDISWIAFGWQKASNDYYGSSPEANCCWEWEFSEQQEREIAQLTDAWKSMVIPEGQKELPQWVLDCVAKLLWYVGTKRSGKLGIPATVVIMHNLFRHTGDFMVHDNWPYPLYTDSHVELLGNDIIQNVRKFMCWLTNRDEPPTFNTTLLMENMRRIGKTHNKTFLLGFGLWLLFADFMVHRAQRV